MKARFLAVAAAMLIVVALPKSESQALTGYEVGSYCGETIRHDHTYATCLTASWDNSAGPSYAIQNNCSSYGNVDVRITTSGDNIRDYIWILTDGNTHTYTLTSGSITGAYCCFDQSDLCHKNQVEADSRGRIRQIYYEGSESGFNLIDVSTHQLRYDFCQANSDDIYCTVDPSGDANTDPNAECNEDTDPPCNCDDHYCKVEDCTSAYENSQASDSCTNDMFSNHSMSISATNGSSQNCTMEGQCRARIETVNRDPEPPYQRWVWDDVEITTDVENMDDLRNCGGALTTDASCADDNQID